MEHEWENALEVLNSGGIIAYPTDTIWGIGCRASLDEAVERIYRLKQRPSHKAMLCLVSDLEMLSRYTGPLGKEVKSLVLETERPTTVIYSGVSGVSPALLGEDSSLGIRLTTDPYCRELVRRLGEPLVSTSANVSGEPNPTCYSDLSERILTGVDYIVNLRRDEIRTTPSRVIKVGGDGSPEILRD